MEKIKKYHVKDFFRNPDKTAYNLSPKGDFVAYLAPFKSRLNIFVQQIGSKTSNRITEITDRDIAGYMWVNNNRILYLKDDKGDENFTLYAVNLDGTESKALTALKGVKTNLVDELEDDDDHIIISLNKRDARVFDPYRLNINSGEMEILAENPGNISGWMCDHDGKLRIATLTDGVQSGILYRTNETEEFKSIITTSFKESIQPLFFTFDNLKLYVSSNLGRDKSVISIFNLETVLEEKQLFEHPEVDVSGLHYSRKRKVLTSIHFTTDKQQIHFLDQETKALYDVVREKVGDRHEIAFTSANKNEDKFIIRTYSDTTRGAYYFFDKISNKFSLIQEVSSWISEQDMCLMEPIRYKSRDGLQINGYLSLPKGKESKNLPAVMLVHGGPWARDTWGFDSEVQFLTNRGYAVLQVNFRGSTGYGRSFWEASFKQWGKKMQDDISDGVNWLINGGIANPKKIAIYGGSYGGYATLAGLTFTSNLYACGIDYVGVSNIFTWIEAFPAYWKPFREMVYEMVGHPELDKEILTAVSPFFHAEHIKAPLLVAQGAQDPRVPLAESDQMVNALKEKGVIVQYLVKNNEGHGFHNEENRFEFYLAMEKFLDEHIGNGVDHKS